MDLTEVKKINKQPSPVQMVITHAASIYHSQSWEKYKTAIQVRPRVPALPPPSHSLCCTGNVEEREVKCIASVMYWVHSTTTQSMISPSCCHPFRRVCTFEDACAVWLCIWRLSIVLGTVGIRDCSWQNGSRKIWYLPAVADLFITKTYSKIDVGIKLRRIM